MNPFDILPKMDLWNQPFTPSAECVWVCLCVNVCVWRMWDQGLLLQVFKQDKYSALFSHSDIKEDKHNI